MKNEKFGGTLWGLPGTKPAPLQKRRMHFLIYLCLIGRNVREMIETVHLENFKSIRKQTVKLNPINILIGQNGAGKSNFISFFQFLEKLADEELSSYIFQKGGINSFLFGGYEKSEFISAKIDFRNNPEHAYSYNFTIVNNGKNYRFIKEEVSYKGLDKEKLEILPLAENESILKRINNSVNHLNASIYATNVYIYIKSLKVYHFNDTSDNAQIKQEWDINDNSILYSEAGNIGPYLLFLQSVFPSQFASIVDAIQLAFPEFNEFVFNHSYFAKGKMDLRYREKNNEYTYSISQLSDGTLRFICLATLLLQPASFRNVRYIILDEPELGLHPFAIHILAELIQKASLDRQIILATQSVELINHFQPEDLLIAERNPEGETIFSRKTTEELKPWLEDYSLGQLWQSNLLGGRP